MRRVLGVLSVAVLLILGTAVAANAIILNTGSSNTYDGVRIVGSSYGDHVSGGDSVIRHVDVDAVGDPDTLEGGCTSGNHAATVTVILERANGSEIFRDKVWLCKSGGYFKRVNVPDTRVACRGARVVIDWKMFDNGGADSTGTFWFYVENVC